MFETLTFVRAARRTGGQNQTLYRFRRPSKGFLRHAAGNRPKTGFDLTYAFTADLELSANNCVRQPLRATIKYLALPFRERHGRK